MDTTRRAQLVLDIVQHAVDRNFDRAWNLLVEVADVSTGDQMYGVCCAFAETGRQALIRLYGNPGPEALWALTAHDPAEGPQHPAHAFAQRFLTAYANQDLPTCQALYLAASKASTEDYSHSVTALLGDVARLSRHALEELAADGETPATHPH